MPGRSRAGLRNIERRGGGKKTPTWGGENRGGGTRVQRNRSSVRRSASLGGSSETRGETARPTGSGKDGTPPQVKKLPYKRGGEPMVKFLKSGTERRVRPGSLIWRRGGGNSEGPGDAQFRGGESKANAKNPCPTQRSEQVGHHEKNIRELVESRGTVTVHSTGIRAAGTAYLGGYIHRQTIIWHTEVPKRRLRRSAPGEDMPERYSKVREKKANIVTTHEALEGRGE